MEPGLYVGRLRHRRFRPRPHSFTYNLFMVLVDVDHVDDQMRRSRLTSVNRFNWATFDDRDHLGDPSRPLRERVTADAARQGLQMPDGPLYLLTHLRYLGYNFNPISFYYCCSRDGDVQLVMAEVHSTFGEMCTYWLTATDDEQAPRTFRRRLAKTMHVSPFMPMSLDYEFIVTTPGQRLAAHMNTVDRAEGAAAPNFDATLTLERREWTAPAIRAQLFRVPVMTAKVVAAIHWEALRLRLKGLRVHPHPRDAAGRRDSQGEARV
ncbi:MAG: DUF1365 domain-containing protein [Acidobacteriota bacterium]